MSDSPAAVTPHAPARENTGRGTLAALLTIPVGVALWVVVWGFGFVASIVGFVVAFGALRLYVWGAGRISRAGAAIVLLTTVITLVTAFFAGIVYDAALALGEAGGISTWEAFTHPEFWPLFGEILPEAFPDYLPDFAWAIGFGALGSFTTLRSAFAAGSPQEDALSAPVVTAPAVGTAPEAGTTPAAAEPQATTGQVPGQV